MRRNHGCRRRPGREKREREGKRERAEEKLEEYKPRTLGLDEMTQRLLLRKGKLKRRKKRDNEEQNGNKGAGELM